MSANEPQNPQNPQEPTPADRFNETLQSTGQKLSEGANVAAEKVKQFAEERNLNEQFEVAGNQLVDRVKSLIDEGNVRRLIIRNQDGRTLLEIPLTAGVAVGGAVLWLNPVLAGLGAIAALLARVTIEIVREQPDAIIQDVKHKATEVKNDVESNVSDNQ